MRKFPVVLRMENYTGLVTKVAIKYWRALPATAKLWIDVEDFVSEGMRFARFELMQSYDYRASSFTTFLTIALKQFYGRKIRDLNRQKRNRGIEINLDDLERAYDDPEENTNTKTPLGSAVMLPMHNPYDVLTCRMSMLKLYDEASPRLQRYLKTWFLNKKPPEVVRVDVSFRKARREFLKLAPVFSVGESECKTLLDDRRKKSLS